MRSPANLSDIVRRFHRERRAARQEASPYAELIHAGSEDPVAILRAAYERRLRIAQMTVAFLLPAFAICLGTTIFLGYLVFQLYGK